MNIARIYDLRNAIQADPEAVDQTTWGSNDDCGTVACAAGHTIRLFRPQIWQDWLDSGHDRLGDYLDDYLDSSADEIAAELLGFDDQTRIEIFHNRMTTKSVLKGLDDLIAYG